MTAYSETIYTYKYLFWDIEDDKTALKCICTVFLFTVILAFATAAEVLDVQLTMCMAVGQNQISLTPSSTVTLKQNLVLQQKGLEPRPVRAKNRVTYIQIIPSNIKFMWVMIRQNGKEVIKLKSVLRTELQIQN